MVLPLPVVTVLVAIFLVFVPITGEPVDAAIAVGLILPQIPVYFIFLYKYKHKPEVFTRINGTFNVLCVYVCTYHGASCSEPHMTELCDTYIHNVVL